MANTTVWTASVWGGAKATSLSVGGKLKEGEEECMICRGDVPASVGFKPCGHTVCFACVENMRAKNIFKADKGVRCPFCRTFIEQYETLKSSNNARAQELLNEANRAAAIAAAARAPPPPPQQVQVTLTSTREPENWICLACNNSNLYWRTECNRCHKPDPRGVKPGIRAKDVLKCTDDEIVVYINEKLHPHLNKAFLEAGTPYCQGRVTGTQEQIIAALKNKGEERLMRVVKALSDSGKLHQCVAHFFGNYTVQDILEATAKLRTATEAHYQYMWDSFRAANDGLDPFGVIHRGMLSVCAEFASHPQGTYVVQKVVELGTCWEVLQLTQRIVSIGPVLTADPRGIHVVAKCMQQLVTMTASDPHPDVATVADALCIGFWKMPDKMKYAAHHGLGAKILADAVQLGLPKFGALKLANRICSRAQDFASSNSGLSIVIALLNVQPMAPGSPELVRDLVCLIAWSLQGHLKDYVMMQEDPRGPFLVEYCIKRLAEEQEIAWIDAVIQELVGAGDLIATSETALEVLKMALSLNVYDTESVEMHLQQLEELVGAELGAEIEADVFARINSNGPPPAPKYFAPSYVQPDLKYHVVNGVRLAPVPLPPDQYAAGVQPQRTPDKKHRKKKHDSSPASKQAAAAAHAAAKKQSEEQQQEETTMQDVTHQFGKLTPEETLEVQQEQHLSSAAHKSSSQPSNPPPPLPVPELVGPSDHGLLRPHPPIPMPIPAAPNPPTHPIQMAPSRAPPTHIMQYDPAPPPPPMTYPYPPHIHPPNHYPPYPMAPIPVQSSHPMPPPFSPMPYTPPMYAPPQPYMPLGPRPAHQEAPQSRPMPVPMPLPVPVAQPHGSSPPPVERHIPREMTVVTHVVTPPKQKRVNVVPKPAPSPTAQAPTVAAHTAILPTGLHAAPPAAAAVPRPEPVQHAAAVATQPARQHGAAVASGSTWECKVCTYKHMAAEAEFLVCAVCGTEKGSGSYQ